MPEVTTIENYAFDNCTNLSSFILSANQNVPNVQTNIFTGITHKISVYIPEGMTESYKDNSNWAYLYNNLCVDFIECKAPEEETIPSGTPAKAQINSFNYGNDLWW